MVVVEVRPYQFTAVRGYREPEAPFHAVFLDEPSFMEAYGLVEYAPPIDFSRQALVAAHRGAKPSAGYHVRLTGACLEGETLVITMAMADPARGLVTAAMISYPRAFGLIERAALPKRAGFTVRFVGVSGELVAVVRASGGGPPKP